MAIPMGLVERIFRENIGFSLREAAAELGIAPSHLYNFEEFKACMDPFEPVKGKVNFSGSLGNFFKNYADKITNEIFKQFITKLIEAGTITNLFQDRFFLSSMSFLSYSFVQNQGLLDGEFYEKYPYPLVVTGGLFYVIKNLLFNFDCELLPSSNMVAIGRLPDKITSFFLNEAFERQWGKKSTKRRKLTKLYPDIIYKSSDSDSIIGYVQGEKDFLDRVFYDDNFSTLILYLLLNKFSFSFFINEKNKEEDSLWDRFRCENNENENPIMFPYDLSSLPPFRDVLVLSTYRGKVSICCRSLIAGYHYDLFVIDGDILSKGFAQPRIAKWTSKSKHSRHSRHRIENTTKKSKKNLSKN